MALCTPGRLILVWSFALTAVACSRPPVPEDPGGYNVVLVSLDTLRADHLGLDGYARDTSPSLDALAETSVVFDLAVAQAPHTRPSHNSLFQSRLPSQTNDANPVLAEILKQAGYQNAAFTGGGHVSAQLGFGRGFELYDERPGGFAESFPAIETWLRQQAEPPFFLFLHTYDIHLPYDPPPPFHTLFSRADYDGPVEGALTRDLVWRIRGRKQYKGAETKVELTAADKEEYGSLYDGGIRYTDQYVGRLVNLLRELNLWRRTILVIFSDHGEEFWDHGSVSHGHTLYQELIRVPLLIRLPGDRFSGQKVGQGVMLMDVVPTLLAALKLPGDPDFQGRNLLPALRQPEVRQDQERPLLAELSRQRTLIRYPWKLIKDLRTGETALFRLDDDPGESLPLSQDDRIAQLEGELDRILAQSKLIDVETDAKDVEDEDLRQQLRALGYLE